MSFDEPITIFNVDGVGPEDVLVADSGLVYAGTEDGRIHEVDAEARTSRIVGTTGGRPLGLEWLPDGRVLVCDSLRGLLSLDLGSGEVSEMVSSLNGRKMMFCNNAAVHSDGTIFFSDSSKYYSIEKWKQDFVEDTHSGRLARRNPDGDVVVLVEGLRFANGVALSADESFVAVAETVARSVLRRWLSGPKEGLVETWLDDLPGYPDNIARGTDGLIWVTIPSPTDPMVEKGVLRAPLTLRKALGRLPEALQPKVKRIARVMAFDDDGRLVHDRQLSSESFHMVTGVREHNGRVWMGSLAEPAIACFDV